MNKKIGWNGLIAYLCKHERLGYSYSRERETES